ncbi:NAD-dependent dehydratase [Lysobacter niastensis]|uniref:NAD-dependent dehydratase n=1 Tax=Lysobacter niastensis TaxID=380629 RepID=A0ABS0B5E7_9GAMM|nr:NAD-dependent dehydratase [Lysobacter niastensis]MBF6024065.1 NAD-dependent dehydratase [Lysobacter niastensis]
MKLLLFGSTGLVGRHALELALEHPAIDTVTAPVRRDSPIQHRKLFAPLVDFDALPGNAPWWHADAVICALGTTMRIAGSEQAFRRVDHDYPLALARLAREHGTRVFVLNSALGADAGSRFFYNRVKGELERDLGGLGFDSLALVRPGLIGGQRDEFRFGERVAMSVLGTLGPLLPRRWRINPADRIAARMIEAAVSPLPGTHVVASDRLT